MNLLTPEQQAFVEEIRELAEAEFAEKAFTWEGKIPWENIERLREAGLYGVSFPKKYGGRGLSEMEAMLLVETVGRVCPDTAYILHNQHFTGPYSIAALGSDATKERYLCEILEENAYIAFAVSEPDAGSDIQSMRTHIEERDGDLVLNGEKTWVGNASKATAAVVWGKFPDGLGSAVVDFDDPGVEVVEKHTNMGSQEQTHFQLDDVVIREEDVLAQGKEGFLEQVDALNWDRVGCAAMANAQTLCALEHALAYAGDREQFGQSIDEFQGIEWKFADAATELEAARAFTYTVTRNAVARDGRPERMHAAMLKLFSANVAKRIVDEMLQIHGACGYQQGHPLEYLYRVVRRWRIAGGTDEIQKNNIAAVLKKHGTERLF